MEKSWCWQNGLCLPKRFSRSYVLRRQAVAYWQNDPVHFVIDFMIICWKSWLIILRGEKKTFSVEICFSCNRGWYEWHGRSLNDQMSKERHFLFYQLTRIEDTFSERERVLAKKTPTSFHRVSIVRKSTYFPLNIQEKRPNVCNDGNEYETDKIKQSITFASPTQAERERHVRMTSCLQTQTNSYLIECFCRFRDTLRRRAREGSASELKHRWQIILAKSRLNNSTEAFISPQESDVPLENSFLSFNREQRRLVISGKE